MEEKWITIQVLEGSVVIPPDKILGQRRHWEAVLAYTVLHKGEKDLISLLESEFKIAPAYLSPNTIK